MIPEIFMTLIQPFHYSHILDNRQTVLFIISHCINSISHSLYLIILKPLHKGTSISTNLMIIKLFFLFTAEGVLCRFIGAIGNEFGERY